MEEILNILKLHLFFREEISDEDINKYVDANLTKDEDAGYDEETGEMVNEYKLKKKIFEILKNDLLLTHLCSKIRAENLEIKKI